MVNNLLSEKLATFASPLGNTFVCLEGINLTLNLTLYKESSYAIINGQYHFTSSYKELNFLKSSPFTFSLIPGLVLT